MPCSEIFTKDTPKLAREGELYGWIMDNSYPRQLVPKASRTQDNSYSRQLVPRTSPNQDNSYPRQILPRTTRTRDDSYLRRLVPMTTRTQDKVYPKQPILFRLAKLKKVKNSHVVLTVIYGMHFFLAHAVGNPMNWCTTPSISYC